jgi:DNA-binding response OmpR family regulator
MTRLLLVEDSPTQAQELTYILQDAGFAVECAGNANGGFDRGGRIPLLPSPTG